MYDFGYLKPISNIIDVLGRVFVALSFIAALVAYATSDESLFGVLIGVLIFVGGGLLGLFFMLISQLVNLFLQIEENTRKRAD